MRCPKCSAEAPDAAAECGGCGLIFAKWRALEERRRAAPAPSGELRPSPAPVFDPWTGRFVAAGLVALWMGLVAWYRARHPGARRHAVPPAGPGQTVYVRDPETGDMKTLKIELPEPAPRPAEKKAAPAGTKTAEMREASWVEETPERR